MPITGYNQYQIAQKVRAMPDGTKGGDGMARYVASLGVVAESATGHGNGGGGAAASGVSAVSGSGSDGAIFLYARRIPKKGAAE